MKRIKDCTLKELTTLIIGNDIIVSIEFDNLITCLYYSNSHESDWQRIKKLLASRVLETLIEI